MQTTNTAEQHDAGGDIRAQTLAAMLARTASDALRAEVDLTPKPGLVDARTSGAHGDMDRALMHASIEALLTGFHDMAAAALCETDGHRLRAQLGVIGRESEARMMLATGGVNTHRGAIWCTGLLVAAAAARPAHWHRDTLLDWVATMAAIDDPAVAPDRESNGRRAIETYGVAGARGEAVRGFVPIRRAGLPVLKQSRKQGAGIRVARLNALLAIMAVLDDTCVLSRAGIDGLRVVQHRARAILDAGGVGTMRGGRALVLLEADLVQMNASPGGSADLLAATLFIDALESASATAWGTARAPGAKEENHAEDIA